MKTESLSQQNFGQLHRYSSLMSKELFSQVSKASCVKKFAKGYNADVFVKKFPSSKNPEKQQLALIIENITPSTYFTKIKQIFSKNRTKIVALKTHAENENDFVNEITKCSSNSILNIYNRKR